MLRYRDGMNVAGGWALTGHRRSGPRLLVMALLVLLAVGMVVVSDGSYSHLAISLDALCVVLAVAAARWPASWLGVGIVMIITCVMAQETSFLSVILCMIGCADLNTEPPRRLGFTMLALGTIGTALMGINMHLSLVLLVGMFMLAPACTALMLRSRVERYRLGAELAEARQAQEKLRLARDMHDTVALSMSHVVMRCARELRRPELGDQERQDLEEIQDDARSALNELRAVLATMRTSDEQPAQAAPITVEQEWDRSCHLLRSAGFGLQTDGGRRPSASTMTRPPAPPQSSPCGNSPPMPSATATAVAGSSWSSTNRATRSTCWCPTASRTRTPPRSRCPTPGMASAGFASASSRWAAACRSWPTRDDGSPWSGSPSATARTPPPSPRNSSLHLRCTMSTEPHTPVRVGLADDDGLVRTALTAILSDEAGIELVWAADNGLAAVDHVAASVHDPSRTVDVVLLDVQMPGIDGLEACRRIRALGQPVAVLMLTTFDPDAYLAEALASGADGFITKDEAAPRLGHVVRAAGPERASSHRRRRTACAIRGASSRPGRWSPTALR